MRFIDGFGVPLIIPLGLLNLRDGRKRYKKNRRRPVSKASFIGQSKSSSLRSQLYSNLPEKTENDNWRLTESFERPVDRRDSRVKRKVFSFHHFINIS